MTWVAVINSQHLLVLPAEDIATTPT